MRSIILLLSKSSFIRSLLLSINSIVIVFLLNTIYTS